MLFNSIDFLVFYIVVMSLYFLIPFRNFRWVLLLVSSYVFYMWWNPIYIVLIMLSTLVDYIAAINMEKNHENIKKKKAYLILSLSVNLGLLFIFKYLNFTVDTISFFAKDIGTDFSSVSMKFLLPMGISFYTFQTLSYSIDVYRGKIKAERHLGYFALYVSFFPQLVAGPIERSDRLLPQLKGVHRFDYDRMRDGLLQMGFGFFKKMVIADRAAIFVNEVFNNAYNIESGWIVIIGAVFFIFQIYCDFSGYSDIAIGSAKIMGIDLMTNFRQPLFSKSIKEFWSRWHISLTSWFRDYLYVPLGGNRKGKMRKELNIFIVFFISGIWHGANLTFLFWGALHGAYQYIETRTEFARGLIRKRLKLSENSVTIQFFRMATTFTFVCFSLIFFRANTIREAFHLVGTIGNLQLNNLIDKNLNFASKVFEYGLGTNEMKLLVIAISILLVIDYVIYKTGDFTLSLKLIYKEPLTTRWAIYFLIIFSIIIFGVYGDNAIREFIYFQF